MYRMHARHCSRPPEDLVFAWYRIYRCFETDEMDRHEYQPLEETIFLIVGAFLGMPFILD